MALKINQNLYSDVRVLNDGYVLQDLQNLKHLDLEIQFSDDVIDVVFALTGLRSLALHHYQYSTPKVLSLSSLSQLRLLTSFDVSGFYMGTALCLNTGLIHLKIRTEREALYDANCFSTLCNLESLSLSFLYPIKHPGRSFLNLGKLKMLLISGVNFNDELFSAISSLPHLTTLGAYRPSERFEDSNMKYINQLSNLRDLRIHKHNWKKLVPGSFPRLKVLWLQPLPSTYIESVLKMKFPTVRMGYVSQDLVNRIF